MVPISQPSLPMSIVAGSPITLPVCSQGFKSGRFVIRIKRKIFDAVFVPKCLRPVELCRIDIYRHNREILGSVLALQTVERGHFLPAGHAPSCP